MRVETKKVYYADDGAVFDDETACKKYEDGIRAKAAATTYWVVHHSPDTTEGRGYCGITYVEAYIPANYPSTQVWLEDWCIKTFGRKLDFVQGVSPMEAWILNPINREKFLKKECGSFGSTRINPKVVQLTIGDRDNGLLMNYDNKAK